MGELFQDVSPRQSLDMSGLAELSQTPFILIMEDVLPLNDLSCLSAIVHMMSLHLSGKDVIDHKEILISTAACRPSEQTEHTI